MRQGRRAHRELGHHGAGSGHLDLSWNDRETDAVATVTGSVNGERIRAERLAP